MAVVIVPSVRVGTVVKLKTGGRKITVCGYEPTIDPMIKCKVICKWFDASQNLQELICDTECLVVIEDVVDATHD